MFIRCAGNGFVQIVNISLVMFAMMYLHGQGVNMRFQCIMRIRKSR